MAKRYDDWMVRLTDYLDAANRIRHESCATFAAGAVKAMTGEDHDLPGTPAEQLAAMRKAGHKTLDDYLATYATALPSPLFAQVGDLAVLSDIAGQAALGVVIGAMAKVVREDRTIGVVPITEAKRAYRV